MPLEKPRRILKIPVSKDPVLLRAEESLRKESKSEAERILTEAHTEAEKVRRLALEAAEKERLRAKEEAARILEEAETKKAQLIAEASQDAREAARNQVLEEFRPRVEEAVERFEHLVHEAEMAWRGCLDLHKNEAVVLALEIARRIVHKIQDEDAELVKRTAEAAIARARDRQSLILRVNPDDLEVLKEYEEELFERFEDIQTLQLEVDRRVDRGGVWIETPSGFIDARITNQLDELMKNVLPEEERPRTTEGSE